MRVEDMNERELKLRIPPEASWHADYADSPYIFVGGLPPGMNEGDLLVMFSQYGCPLAVKLVRDRDGVSKRFAYVKYEDQRSTVLAVDNFNGVDILGYKLRVDHSRAEQDSAPVPLSVLYDDASLRDNE